MLLSVVDIIEKTNEGKKHSSERVVRMVNLLTGRVTSRFAPLLHSYADNSSVCLCVGKRHKYVDSSAFTIRMRHERANERECANARVAVPHLAEPKQFVAREVCIGLGPSPRATRSPHGEHDASNATVPRLRINPPYSHQLCEFLGENVGPVSQQRDRQGREYNFHEKLTIVLV